MKKRIGLLMWIAVLILSLSIQVLFVCRVGAHPKNVLTKCEHLLSYSATAVPADSRSEAEQSNAQALRLSRRFVQGFRESCNVATLIAMLSIIGIFIELKQRRIQQKN